MFAVFGIATIVALVFGAGAATDHVVEKGVNVQVAPLVK